MKKKLLASLSSAALLLSATVAHAHFQLVYTPPEPRTDDARYIPEEVYLHWEPDAAPRELDLQAEGIRSVVLATGFVAEWPWLDVPGALDAHGYPLGDFGVSPQPGLFFIGMMRRR